MTPRTQPAAAGSPGATTLDFLLDGRVRLRQPARGYRAAIDPVLLAASVEAGAGESLLDLGCGVGAAALCLLAREPEVRVAGLEVQGALAALARANAEENGFAGRFEVVEGDLREAADHFPPEGFDRVLMNPPYLGCASGRPSKLASRDLAQREGETGLAHWLAAARQWLRPKGTLNVIYRADRLADLLAGLAPAFGGIRLFPLWPAEGRPAKRIIVAARKGVAAPGGVSCGLVLHRGDGAYTAAAEAVLREAAPLVW
ncbi:MAG: methyltransferase [Kiloniellales bacterium]|nr:methyltransferase [Kiloniellales bacterium]